MTADLTKPDYSGPEELQKAARRVSAALRTRENRLREDREFWAADKASEAVKELARLLAELETGEAVGYDF